MDMPYVSTFVYCEESQIQDNNKKLILVNPKHILTPSYIPGQFSFGVLFGILDVDTTIEHTLRYKFLSPKGEIIIDTKDIKMPPNKNINLPEDMRGIMLNFDFRNVELPIEGEYISEVFCDNELIGKFPIKVKGVKNK